MKKVIMLIVTLILMTLSIGCSSAVTKTDDSATINLDETDTTATSSENAETDPPFNVLIDKTILETRQSKQATVLIDTELTDWSYTVQAEHGSITNVGENSFDYSIPKDIEQIEDTITIQFSDEENKRTYKCQIPLHFPVSPEEPTKSPLPID
ncbi:MAG: hypothetical protein ACLUNJ_23185 [Enterocloster sp.]|uniref:hypothetical protein n=1 Tax=Enterocloster sp. TaxID=2719315 RepID=UPI0039947909